MEVQITDTPEGQRLKMGPEFDGLKPAERVNLQLRIAAVGARLMGVKHPLSIRFIPAAPANHTPEGKDGNR